MFLKIKIFFFNVNHIQNLSVNNNLKKKGGGKGKKKEKNLLLLGITIAFIFESNIVCFYVFIICVKSCMRICRFLKKKKKMCIISTNYAASNLIKVIWVDYSYF